MSMQLFLLPFLFSGYFVLLMLVLSVLFLVDVISLPLRFFMLPSSRCIDASMLYWMLASPLSPSFLDSYSLIISRRPYASSWVFLYSGPFVEVLLWSTLRIVRSILRRGQPRYLSLWWDFCHVFWFRVVFSFSWGILFFIFFHHQ